MAITAAELVVRVGADTSDAESGLKSFGSKMKGMTSSLAGVGGVLSATIGAPLIGLGVSAVKTAATFERSMNVLGQVSGATGKQLQQMSDQALQLGADTVFSSNEAASGMVELAKAGMTTAQVMDAIPGVMDLAAAGAIGVEEAASLTAATLNTFGLEASKSAEVADVLAAAANASAADITDLAFGVQNAGSIFAASGQSVQTLATMMALLANNGLNASDAATSLKTMTLRLTAPTAQAAKEMKKLGINVFNADGSMRDYHDIIVDLSRSTAGLTDQQRSMALSTIFGADAMRAANIMVKEGATGYEAMSKAVEQQGAAAQMANAQNSGLSGAMEQISGSIESLMTKLALPFLPTISAWMTQLTDLINKMGELPQPVINAALAFGVFAIALGAALLAGAGIAKVFEVFTATEAATTIGAVSLSLLGLALAAAALWAAWQTNFGNIQEKTASVMAVINPLIQTLGTNLNNAASYVTSIATSMAVLLALNPQWQTLITNVKGAASALSDLATHPGSIATNVAVLLALNPQWQTLVTNIKAAASALSGFGTSLAVGAASFAILLALNPQWQGFIANVQSAAAAVGTLATNLAAAVINFKLPDTKSLQTLKSNVEMQVNATVKTLLKPPQLTITPFPPMTIPPPVVKIAPLAPQTLPAPVIKAAEGPGKIIDSLTATIKGGDWAGVGHLLGSVIIASWNAEVAKIKPMLSFVGMLGAFGTAWNQFQTNFVGALIGFGIAIGSTGIAGKIATLGTTIADAFTTMWDNLMSTVKGAFVGTADATSTSDVLRDRALSASFKWPELPEFKWPDLPTWTWPDYSTFTWPEYLTFDWPDYDRWEWPKLPEWHWPDMQMPGWVGALINALGGAMGALSGSGTGGGGGGGMQEDPGTNPPSHRTPRLAEGTSYWRGGTTWVGEHGPELVSLPQGSQVYSNGESMAMAAGGVSISIAAVHVHNDMDVEQLVSTIARRLQQKMRL
jgi:TP901 family phage tail tape measure protein